MIESFVPEYRHLLKRKRSLEATIQELPKGYISTKEINGKKQYYLQWREKDKVRSKYISGDMVETLREKVYKRKLSKQELIGINKQIDQLEKMAKMLGDEEYALLTNEKEKMPAKEVLAKEEPVNSFRSKQEKIRDSIDSLSSFQEPLDETNESDSSEERGYSLTDEKYWENAIDEYILNGEPDYIERSYAWKTAIGLQAVDGLTVSDYLLDVAKENIEGKIGIQEASKKIESYYTIKENRQQTETKEADIVSARIATYISQNNYHFSPSNLKDIHKSLFEGVWDHAGKYRDYDISKKEWVLGGATVRYMTHKKISEALKYDFDEEQNVSYEGISKEEFVRNIAKFTARIWQIHPFGEGNTRTTAVFILLYLRHFGFEVTNETFAKNSWYFRNALVRANYTDYPKGITETNTYLEKFFDNLLFDGQNVLKNRYLHIDYVESRER